MFSSAYLNPGIPFYFAGKKTNSYPIYLMVMHPAIRITFALHEQLYHCNSMGIQFPPMPLFSQPFATGVTAPL